jgi:hypothetical protein
MKMSKSAQKIENERLKIIEKMQNIILYNKKINTSVLYSKERNKYDVELKKENDLFLEKNPDFESLIPIKEPSYLKLYIAQAFKLNGISETAKNFVDALIQEDMITAKGFIKLTKKEKIHIYHNVMGLKDPSRAGLTRLMKELTKPIEALNNIPVLISYPLEEFEDNIEKFYINPILIGAGSWENVRNRRLRITLDYQDDGQKITIENLDKLENFNTKTETYCSENKTNKKVFSVSENTGAFFDENDVDFKGLFENEE